ncbi:MAG TPA: xanthine dehydrogenase family protein subunit M [Burkholderiales bacterium]|jgi:carbon-monoxide dehydrogenase medium subunit|nr:xanthine dehydrogenase family protein subunit M [Burkholderiales bacterium]
MRRFAYHEPATLDEAVALAAAPNAQILAGGTDLLVELKEQLRRADCVVNIKKVAGLGGLRYDAGGLHIGALATAREVEISPIVLDKYRSLMQSVRELGSIQVRHRATIVGNICRASPSADTIPPLIADGATIRIRGAAGERGVPLEDFFLGPGKTILAPGEVVIEILAPSPLPDTRKIYIKHGRRKAMELATVGVAVTHVPGGETRIVLGAVAPTPIRARRAEELLRANRLTDELIAKAAQAAVAESRPISNVRASAEYRREMVGVLTRRALEQVR